MLPCEFHPLAEAELEESVAFYEAAAPGKGLELAEQIRAAIEELQRFPEAAPLVRGSIRCKLVQPDTRWHYTIYYRVKPDCLRILAVAHQKRQPFYWFGRR